MRPWELHPALVHFPIAFILGAVALDLYAWLRFRVDLAAIATGLLVAGVASALVAAAAGVLAFFTVPAHTHDAHGLMYWHLGINVVAVGLLAVVARYRWTARHWEPSGTLRALGIAGALILSGGSYLGGEIVYKGGAGIDPAILAPEVREHEHGGHEHGPEHSHVHD
jgi:uncharacterized membrane protein